MEHRLSPMNPVAVKALQDAFFGNPVWVGVDPGKEGSDTTSACVVNAKGEVEQIQEDFKHSPAKFVAGMMARYKKAHTPITRDVMPGRNDPCPCGSGKKFKKCHLGGKQ